MSGSRLIVVVGRGVVVVEVPVEISPCEKLPLIHPGRAVGVEGELSAITTGSIGSELSSVSVMTGLGETAVRGGL